jgi:3-deoxy-D-manno-octulosonate 8-phosphate phosphatase (KDO 8-P phosphatase)
MVVSDVDGVLTDGVLGLTESGDLVKFFSVQDGLGAKLLEKAGIRVAFLSSHASDLSGRRARDLGLSLHFAGVERKRPLLEQLLADEGVAPADACYVGDDLVDLPCLAYVGFPAAVANARDEVKRAAKYVTANSGGRGAFRELAEHILKTRGLWASLLETYR